MEQVIYNTIAENIKRLRKKNYMSQAKLAELADVSVDTIKSVEAGRRTMSLETYMGIVNALKTTPVALMSDEEVDEYTDRILLIVKNSSERDRKFVLYMIEQLVKGQERYLKD